MKLDLQQMPDSEPRALFSEEGRREIATLLVWGSSERAHYDRSQIQVRIECFLRKYAEGILSGKYRDREKANAQKAGV